MWKVFHQAVETEASARDAFLEEACAGDRRLRRQVEKLLAAHETGEGLLDRPLVVGLGAAEKAAPPGSEHSAGGESEAILEPGEVLADRFEITRWIGQGGMGVVYAAFDRALETEVALKILRPGIARDPAALERFHTEINLARRVTHPNACRVFDLFRHGDDVVFLTMELLGGETLADRVRREGPLAVGQALPIIEQVASALSAAHEVGIVHRDLKGTNVMLVAEGDTARAVVTDFGLATTPLREESALELSRTGELLGTPAFMAPEQLTGGPVTSATDVYALGLVIYQMLTRRLPFEGETPYEVAARRLREEATSPCDVVPDLDPRWERTILRCLEREPEDRFQSPADVVEALRADAVPLPPSRARRWRRGFGLAAVIAAALLAAWFILQQPWIGESEGRRGAGLSAAGALDFQERDWVLITAFENRTGEALLDGTVEAALGRELANSRFVNVVPRQRIADALRLMKKPLESRVDRELGLETALRDGGIRALLHGQIARWGSSYVMSVELVNPSDGVAVATVSEEAVGQEAVLPAVRRLSNEVRRLLGERLAAIPRARQRLTKVTTPSLAGLQLYTQADLLLQASPQAGGAEQLLRRAIAADPLFASASNLLAWTLWRKDRSCSDECMSYSEQAVESAETATDRERYFILGSHHWFRKELGEAEANYRALLRIDPDHYWGLQNLAWLLRVVGRPEEAVPLMQRQAEVAPNSLAGNVIAGDLTLRFRSLEEAEPYYVRASELLDEDTEYAKRRWPLSRAWSYWVQKAWLEEDIDGVVKKVEEWARPGTNRPKELQTLLYCYAGLYLRDVGKLRAAEEIYRRIPDEDRRTREVRLRSVELSRVDQEHWKEVLQRSGDAWSGPLRPIEIQWGTEEEAWLHARAGLVAEARRLLASLSEDEGASAAAWDQRRLRKLVAEGEVALAEGRARDAIPRLEEAISGLGGRAIYRLWSFFWASESLARAWELEGNIPNAQRVLEEASVQKGWTFSGKLGWMDVQLHLARLYRELGREEEAREIESELRRLLVYADPDFRILRQLEKQSQIAHASSDRESVLE